MPRRFRMGLAAISVAAIAVVAVLVLPGLFDSDEQVESESDPVDIEYVTVIPEHWWTASITEERLQLLGEAWGDELAIIDMVQMLWPDVIPELPQDMVETWEESPLLWPVDEWDTFLNSPMQTLYNSSGGPHDGKMFAYDFFIGMKYYEDQTFEIDRDLGVVAERRYRISLYTSEAIG